MIEAIRVLFKQWKAWFKNRMKTKGDDFDWSFEMVLVWANYLTKKQITAKEFKLASERSFDQQWMPSNGQEFLALARIDGEVYPTATEAFDNACSQCGLIEDRYVKREWLHAVVLETANRIGWGKLKTADSRFVGYFSKVYEQVVAEHQAGATFVIPQSHQVEYEHTPVQAGSEVDKKISEQLSNMRRVLS